jgi:hypothetical protein
MKRSLLFFVRRSCSSTMLIWARLSRLLLISIGFCLTCPAFAERPAPRADDKADDKVDRRMEEEANLPIYHMPLKGVHASGLSKNQSETKLLPLRQPQSKSSRLATAPGRAKIDETRSASAKLSRLDSSTPKTLAKLDSLVQTQDKARQRAVYGFKPDEPRRTSPQLVLAEQQKTSLAKPIVVHPVVPPPQIPINKAPILPVNAAIRTRNDLVPHRGPGTSSLGGPANVRTTGISGSDMKIRP